MINSSVDSLNESKPKQIARDHIDRLLVESRWLVQPKSKLNLDAVLGVAVTEYRTGTGPVDYLLFIDRKPVGIIEAKETSILFSELRGHCVGGAKLK